MNEMLLSAGAFSINCKNPLKQPKIEAPIDGLGKVNNRKLTVRSRRQRQYIKNKRKL